MEYKLMTKEELTNYIYDFWNNFGGYEDYDIESESAIKKRISQNLSTLNGIDTEIDDVRFQFDNYDEESWEYEELDKLWNYLNWYKTNFEKGLK